MDSSWIRADSHRGIWSEEILNSLFTLNIRCHECAALYVYHDRIFISELIKGSDLH